MAEVEEGHILLLNHRLPLSTYTPLLLLCCVLFASISFKASSASVRYTEDRPFSELLIQGEIQKGDYQKILNILKINRDVPYKISLQSKGGNVMEALKIGSLTRQYLMRIETTTCNSACVFILLGSLFKNENKLARYGIHRPKFHPEYFARLNMQQATLKYQALYAVLEKYMYSMGATKALVDKIFSIPSSSMEYLGNSQLYAMTPSTSQIYSEWMLAKCGDDLSLQEQRQLTSFQQNSGLLDKSYYLHLEAKSTEYFNCELESVRNEQMRIFKADKRFHSNQMSLNN